MKFLAILCARISGWLLSCRNRGGSYPGQLALKICPSILHQLQIKGDVILVTGTNGKTSTANMTAQSLLEANKKVIQNAKGDNMKNGIVTALLRQATLSGKVDCDMAVLEVDELSMPYIMQHLHVHHIIITNFFRDQLDRASEMEQLIQTVQSALQRFRGNLILNANDPNTVRFAYMLPQAQSYFYGVEPQLDEGAEEAREGTFCPVCGDHLVYSSYQYSHIGTFQCPSCNFQTPAHALTATNVKGQEFMVHFDTYRAPIHALYMIYNCMAVLSLFDVLHLDKTYAKKAFQNFRMPMGRNEVLRDQGRDIVLHLVKNPTGTNEVLKQIANDLETHLVLFVLNDNPQDGTDISWIYDADFERIFQDSLCGLIMSGTRAYEGGLRMKYGSYVNGFLQVEQDVKTALHAALSQPQKVYILTTYTALAPMRDLLEGELK